MLFESFTELAEAADMPGTEKIGTRPLRLFGRLGRRADRYRKARTDVPTPGES